MRSGTLTTPPAQPQSQPVAERRFASILFVDLVGFTPYSETRDAEDVRELLSRYFDVARTVISRYGGVVEKFIGDAVMAVWGVPTAHGNDAERAVRAALDLVDSVATLGADAGAAELRARAGVVTGEVAVTVGAVGEGMVAGDAVNTAARVQAEAEPSTVFVDEVTRQASAAAIAYTDAGSHSLKGKTEPVRLFRANRVVGTIGGTERVDGLEASFLGRDRELRQVKEVFHDVLDTGRARLVSVVGAAGVGKSRLRWEFIKYTDGLATRNFWHGGRCLPYGEGVAYWALAEMVRARLDIAEDETPESAAQKLAEGLDRWVTASADREFLTPRLGALLGVAEPGLPREDLFAGWRLWFERLAEHQPVVMVVEDLQWADAGLLDFLEHLLDWSADRQIFVLTLARPELLERRPTYAATRRNALSLTLEPLPDAAMGALLGELVPGMPADVQERIVRQADGIPLYAVELVRSLIDRDLVMPVEGAYRLMGQVDVLDVPASLTSLVASRIDALPPEERSMVQGLAVLGGTFPRAAVPAVTDLSPDEADRLLADLVRKEILSVRTDRHAPDIGQYAFTQSLLCQVAHDTLSRRDRKTRHLAVATHLRDTFPDDGADVVEVIAQHYLEAYRAAPDATDSREIAAEAVIAFTRAATRAVAIGAPESAQAAYETAAELSSSDEERMMLREQATEAVVLAGNYEGAFPMFERLAVEHASAGRPRDAARLNSRAGFALYRSGRLAEARALVEPALEVLSTGEPDAVLARAHLTLATTLLFSGQVTDGVPHVEDALEIAEALRLPDVLAEAAERKGLALHFANRHEEARVMFEWAVDLAEARGLTLVAGRAHANAGDFLMSFDLPGGIDHCEAAMVLARRGGEAVAYPLAASNLALLYMFVGRWDEAERMCLEIAADLEAHGRYGAEYMHSRLLQLAVWRGDFAQAHEEMGRLGRWAVSDDAQHAAQYASLQAALAFAAGDFSAALEHGERAATHAINNVGISHEVVRITWPTALEAALKLDKLDDVQRVIELIAKRPVGHIPPYLEAELAHYRALRDFARGNNESVQSNFLKSEDMLEHLEYPYPLARAQVDHARWLMEQSRVDEAEQLLAQALPAFQQLGAAPMVGAVSALVERTSARVHS